MSSAQHCRVCGAALPGGPLGSRCPQCLLYFGLEVAAEHEAPIDLPSSTTGPPLSAGSGSRFGDYELLEEIARGGMGVVFKARQVSLNRIVALKMIRAERLARSDEVRRFRQEAAATARLQHANIVAIHEAGEVEGQHFYSMDFVEGRNLAGIVRDHPVSARQAATYVRTIAEAIHVAHQHGILHRDLKPSNILIDAQDQPRVADFGLAKVLHSESELTLTGEVMGSPSYMAPEQAAGRSPEVDARTDVYALGAILYELLSGRPPFKADTSLETLKLVVESEPVSLRLVNPNLPRDLETICLRCLEKEPSRRYASAEALAEDLDRWLRGDPIVARPVHWWERVIKWARRKPAMAVLVGVVVSLLVAGVSGVLWQWRRAVGHAQEEARQRAVAEQESQRAREAVTRLEIERAESLLNADGSTKALPLLARLLREQPTNRVVAERLMSALTHRRFCLPLVQLVHRDQARAPQFDRHGARVLTVFEPNAARIYDAVTGEPRSPPFRHRESISSARFSPDDGRVLTASVDGTAQVWDAPSGAAAAKPLVHPAPVLCAEFSRDGREIVTASQDRGVRRWDTQTGAALGQPITNAEPVAHANFSPDGRLLVIVGARSWARVVEARTGAQAVPRFTHYKPDGDGWPQFSPDSRQLLGHDSFHWLMWDLDSRQMRDYRDAHKGEVDEAVFSPDGRLVATAAYDNTARLWDAATGKAASPPLPHSHWVVAACFSADGRQLATGCRDGSVRVWEVATGRPLTEPLAHGLRINSVQFSPDGRRLLTHIRPHRAFVWNVRAAPAWLARSERSTPIRHATFSPDGRRVAMTSFGTSVHLWDPAAPPPGTKPLTHREGLHYTEFSQDGQLVLTASEDHTAGIWEAQSGRLHVLLQGHTGWVRHARFSPDRGSVATASWDGRAGLWNATNGQLLAWLQHQDSVTCVQFSPDGQRLATASADWTARLWDRATGQALTSPLRHEDQVRWVEFSPDGHYVATASMDKTARIWDSRSGALLFRLIHTAELDQPHALHFSPDGTRLATAAGKTAHLWDPHTGQSLTAPLVHDGQVCAVRFTPDGSRLVTACQDGAARIWDSRTGQLLSEPFRHEAQVSYAEASPDGRQLLTASVDFSARIWELPPTVLPAPAWLAVLAEALAGQRLTAGNVSTPLRPEELLKMREALKQVANGGGGYASWAEWFRSEAPARLWPARRESALATNTAAEGTSFGSHPAEVAPQNRPVPHPPGASAGITLGGVNREEGLRLCPHGDGVTEADEAGGVECRCAIKQLGKSSYIYFAVAPQYKSELPREVLVEVEYFDWGEGRLSIEYDAAPSAENAGGVYVPSAKMQTLTDTKRWLTASFGLTNAQFRNAQNAGADFRIAVLAPRMSVRRVTVSGLATNSAPQAVP